MVRNNTETPCIHCGQDCGKTPLILDDKKFCCNGCITVYQLLNDNKLYKYYELEKAPGIKVDEEISGDKYAYLENIEIQQKLYTFADGNFRKVVLYFPSIHCSSCIWLLENLHKLHKGVLQSSVNFVRKEVSISFNINEITLRQLVELLVSIHYIPEISLDNHTAKKAKPINKQLIYKIGIAGFCFGNTMLISLPEYLTVGYKLEQNYRTFFGFISILLSLPVFFYSASDYFITSYKHLKRKIVSIEIPIAIGILALWLWSLWEIVSGTGPGFMDSLAGLLFFLLTGKWYQQRTYEALSFDRDFRSYFPVAVTKIFGGVEEITPLEKLKTGDTIRIRNQELIPADGILKNGTALIDYSFVTGETSPIERKEGDLLYAGGRQKGAAIEILITNEIDQSHLTKLWNEKKNLNDNEPQLHLLIDKIAQRFTIIVLSIAFLTGIYWYLTDIHLMLRSVVSVLIVACPCALALSIPFSYGNAMRLLGKTGFYLKNADVIEKLTKINTIVFDKTGTITLSEGQQIKWQGISLDEKQNEIIKSVVKHSTHPLSVAISQSLSEIGNVKVENYNEIAALGIQASINKHEIKIGSKSFVIGNNEMSDNEDINGSRIDVAIDNIHLGYFVFANRYRPNLDKLIDNLMTGYELHLLTGDNENEKNNLLPIFKNEAWIHFRQSPEDKLNYVRNLKSQNKNVLMIGDGLNDAGALMESNAGISIADNVYCFSPACDAILNAQNFAELNNYLRFSKVTLSIVKASFVISFMYNSVGIWFAVRGMLSPVIAAILMPLSSVTVVGFVTLATSIASSRILKETDKFRC